MKDKICNNTHKFHPFLTVLWITLLVLLIIVNITSAAPFAYVTHYNGDTVSVIDVATNNVVKTVQVGPAPRGIAITPDGTKAYVGNYMGDLDYSPAVMDSVSVINTTNNTVMTTVYTGSNWPDAIAITPDGSKAYVVCETGYISVINTVNDTVIATIPVGKNNPQGIAIAPDGKKAYVTNLGSGTVNVINTTTNNITALIPTGGNWPEGIAVTPDGGKLYIANGHSSNVAVINTTTNNITTKISVGSTPTGIAISPDGKKAYVTNYDSNTVSVVNTTTNTVTNTVDVERGPWGIAVTPDGTRVYVTNLEDNSVSVIDDATNSVISTVSVGSSPIGVAIYNPRMFQPVPNGYKFENFNAAALDTDDFQSLYGLNVNLSNKNSKITKFYLDYFKYMGRSGNCFGMSATSLLLYNDKVDNAYDYNETDEISDALLEYGTPLHDPYYLNLKYWIIYEQSVQVDKACLNDKIKYKAFLDTNRNVFVGFPTVYDELKKRLESNDYSMTLDFTGYIWDDTNKEFRKGAHAVVPYKIDESPDKQSAKIYVYDCNHPGDFNKYIEVNLNTWKVADYDFIKDIFVIHLCSLEAIKEPAQISDLTTLRKNISPAHLLYTDISGRKLGYDNGVFRDEIPGTCFILPSSEDTDNNSSIESYYVPDSSIKMELYGTGSDDSEVSMMTSMGLINANVPVSSTSIDEFKILNNGTGIEFKSKNDTMPSLGLMLDIETGNSAQVVEANISQIEINSTIDLFNDNGIIGIQNQGLSKTCSMHLEQVEGGQNSSGRNISSITIEDNSTIYIEPSDWKNVSSSIITIEHDIGSDGNVDYIENISPNDITSPSTVMDLQFTSDSTWINWTWTNPTDTDFNHTEIYLDGIFQTNTSAESFNSTGLEPDTSYTIGTRTLDNSGNVNETWVNASAKTKPLPDITLPIIGWVVLFPANTTASSKISVTVNATDNIGVVNVTADDVQLTKVDGLWRGSITAPSSTGKYSLSIRVSDVAGNTATASTPYNVVRRKGSASIGIVPEFGHVVAGKSSILTIKVKNTQNVDDAFKIQITNKGYPSFYRADLSWFNWTEKTVDLRAKQEIWVPVQVNVPAGITPRVKLFKASVNSETYPVRGSSNGYLILSSSHSIWK